MSGNDISGHQVYHFPSQQCDLVLISVIFSPVPCKVAYDMTAVFMLILRVNSCFAGLEKCSFQASIAWEKGLFSPMLTRH